MLHLHYYTTCISPAVVLCVTQIVTTKMNIVIVIVAAYVFAVGVLQAHAEAEEDFDVSAVRLVRRARRVYLSTWSSIYHFKHNYVFIERCAVIRCSLL